MFTNTVPAQYKHWFGLIQILEIDTEIHGVYKEVLYNPSFLLKSILISYPLI
jgi:hypothetical protein